MVHIVAKPHLNRINGKWRCQYGLYSAYGNTPLDAFLRCAMIAKDFILL